MGRGLSVLRNIEGFVHCVGVWPSPHLVWWEQSRRSQLHPWLSTEPDAAAENPESTLTLAADEINIISCDEEGGK